MKATMNYFYVKSIESSYGRIIKHTVCSRERETCEKGRAKEVENYRQRERNKYRKKG
jgi:hypothetical protein